MLVYTYMYKYAIQCFYLFVPLLLTFEHTRHIFNDPRGEITIEDPSTLKHCTTATTKKSPMIKNGLEYKGERALFKNRISAAQK